MVRLQEATEKPAFQHTPDEYPEECTLHWCLPSDNPEARTFNAREYQSGKLHLVDLEYGDVAPDNDPKTRDRYNSVTAARTSRRIKNGPASECPFCSDTDFNHLATRLSHNHNYSDSKRWEAEVLKDFKETVIASCRPERDSGNRTFKPDVNFAEITTDFYDNPKMEILTNTDSLRYAYPEPHSLPNWYTLGYAIAQNPWLQVEEVTEFETDNVRVLVTAKRPNPEDYGEYYYQLLSQRDTIPYETKTPEDNNR